MATPDWQSYWDEQMADTAERSPEFDTSEYYRSGRVSKLWPDKEGPEWWAVNGPKFVKSWTNWREASGLKLWSYVDQESGELIPGIENEVYAYGPDGLIVRCFIDRVFYSPENQKLYVVDLKSGSHTPAWPQQLALNALAFRQTFGEEITYGGFWKARDGGVKAWHDLTKYSDEWLWEQVWKAREIRDRQLFIATPNNLCASACGVSKFCVAMGGSVPPELVSRDISATMTQEKEGTE